MPHDEKCGHGACVRPKGHSGSHSVHLEGTPFAVPQGEDHEARAVAALYEFAQERWGWGSEEYESVRDAVDVVLARVYPSRDGTVAVEDVERLQAAIDKAYGAMNASAYVGGPSEREAWQTAMAALGEVVTQHKGQGEFGSARAGESNEGGNQNDERRH